MANNRSKPNNFLNGLWASHAKKDYKRRTSKARRRDGRARIHEQRDGEKFFYRRRGR